MTDYEAARRIESARNHLDVAFQHARSSEARRALSAADSCLKTLKADLGHPRAGLAQDVSPLGCEMQHEPEWFPNEGDRQFWREKHKTQ